MKVTQVILMLILSYSKSGVVSDCFINNFLACLTRMGGPSSPSMSSSGIQDGSFHGHTLFSILMFSPSFLMARGGPKELHPTFQTSSKPWRDNWFYIESFLKGGKVTQVFLLLWVSLRILTYTMKIEFELCVVTSIQVQCRGSCWIGIQANGCY